MNILKSLLIINETKKKIYFEKSINHFGFPENYKNSDANMFLDEHFKTTVDDICLLEYDNVVVSNSVIFQGLKYAENSAFHVLNGNHIGFNTYAKSFVKAIFKRKSNISVAYWAAQEWGDNFYHFALELLPNLINFHFDNPQIPILVPTSYKSKKFIVDYFSIIGIQPIYFNPKNVAYVDKLYVSPLPRVGVFNKLNLLNGKKQIEVNSLKINYKEPFRKVYISRSGANKRKISNEEDVINFLKSRGFEIIVAEDIDLSTLISILSETSVLISNHGAGLSNILHLQPGQTIVELKALNDNYWMYFSLSKILDHKYFYLFNKCDSINYRESNIEVDVIELESIINNIIHQ